MDEMIETIKVLLDYIENGDPLDAQDVRERMRRLKKEDVLILHDAGLEMARLAGGEYVRRSNNWPALVGY